MMKDCMWPFLFKCDKQYLLTNQWWPIVYNIQRGIPSELPEAKSFGLGYKLHVYQKGVHKDSYTFRKWVLPCAYFTIQVYIKNKVQNCMMLQEAGMSRTTKLIWMGMAPRCMLLCHLQWLMHSCLCWFNLFLTQNLQKALWEQKYHTRAAWKIKAGNT